LAAAALSRGPRKEGCAAPASLQGRRGARHARREGVAAPPLLEASGSKPRQPGRQIKTKSGTKCSWDLGVGSNHTCWPIFWVPEGSLAGFCVRHHLALESVCGADFSWKVMCGAGPGDLGGSRGSASTENPKKTGPKISSQTALRYPGQGVGATAPAFFDRSPGTHGPAGPKKIDDARPCPKY